MPYKDDSSDAAVTSRSRLPLRRIGTLLQTNSVPCTIEEQIIQGNLDLCIKAQMAKKREENLQWEKEIGSLIYATVAVNFD